MSEDIDTIEELLSIKKKRLHELEKKAATYGIDTPPAIALEIENLRTELDRLERKHTAIIAASRTIHSTIPLTPAAAQHPLSLNQAITRAAVLLVVIAILGVILYILGTTNKPPSGSTDTTLALKSIPFFAFSWSRADVKNEQGSNNLTVINNNDSSTSYKFDYSLPITSTKYSGSGLTFRLEKPQDLSEYSRVRIVITFENPGDLCYILLYDITGNYNPVPLGIRTPKNQDISVQRDGDKEIYTIPLKAYFNAINTNVVNEISLAVDTTNSPGNHYIILHNIEFLKQ